MRKPQFSKSCRHHETNLPNAISAKALEFFENDRFHIWELSDGSYVTDLHEDPKHLTAAELTSILEREADRRAEIAAEYASKERRTYFALRTGFAEISLSKCRVKSWEAITLEMLEDNALNDDGDKRLFSTFEEAKAEYDVAVSRFSVGRSVGMAGVTKGYEYAYIEEEHYLIDPEDGSEEYDDQNPDNGLRTPVAVEPIVRPEEYDNEEE